jgi:hypothetical protein
MLADNLAELDEEEKLMEMIQSVIQMSLDGMEAIKEHGEHEDPSSDG